MTRHAHRRAGTRTAGMFAGRRFRIVLIKHHLIAGLQLAADNFDHAAVIEAANDIDPSQLASVGDPDVPATIGFAAFGLAAMVAMMLTAMSVLG